VEVRAPGLGVGGDVEAEHELGLWCTATHTPHARARLLIDQPPPRPFQRLLSDRLQRERERERERERSSDIDAWHVRAHQLDQLADPLCARAHGERGGALQHAGGQLLQQLHDQHDGRPELLLVRVAWLLSHTI
jgi:hypothetical protein